MSFTYEKAVVGGTFDHFHPGHQKLIDTAFEQSSRVTIGLTKPVMYEKKLLAGLIQDFETRKKRLEDYLHEKEFTHRSEIIPIEDIYGNTLQEKDIEAIFVTEENLPNVEKINAKREEQGFPKITSILVPYVKDNNGDTITSERIRRGDIASDGFVYQSLFVKQVLTLPESVRPELQKPIGQVVATTEEVLALIDEKIVLAVGDIISEELRQKNVHPGVSIIDFRTRRHELLHASFGNEHQTINEQGTVNKKAVQTIISARDTYLTTQEPQTIIVEGEEDLLALPAILFAPLGSIVLYGQFDQGVVVNTVTEKLKKEIMRLLEKFG